MFLGILYDWHKGVKSIPEEKRLFSIAELQGLRDKGAATMEAWRSCLFRINHLAGVIPNLRMFLNSGFLALHLAERARARCDRQGEFTFDPMLQIDITSVLKLVTENGGREVAIQAPDTSRAAVTFYSDSSDKGVGGWHWVDESHTHVVLLYGLWSREEVEWLDITTLEGLGALTCLLALDTPPKAQWCAWVTT